MFLYHKARWERISFINQPQNKILSCLGFEKNFGGFSFVPPPLVTATFAPASFLLFLWLAQFQWESQLIKLVLLLILAVSASHLI